LAIALAESGTLVFVADRQLDHAAQVVRQIEERGGRGDAIDLDVRNRERFAEVVSAVVRSSGRIDYLFNNAGIGVLGQAAHFNSADWLDVLDVNLSGVCHGIAAAYPQMIRQGGGHIVNVASLAGLVPAPLIASYTASKFAIVGLSRALRVEAARHAVCVSVVCPFIIDTPLLTGGRYGRINDDVKQLTEWRPLLRWLAVSPESLARRVLQQIARNRGIIVHPAWARVFWHIDRFNPWLSERLTRALMNRFHID
jgi:NAD(P)-dependent dehydrogenase (short-subunit alcohol dehydrogenase family)